jgi:hypothetical protein
MIPPAKEAVNPHIDKAAALSMAYSALKAGKFLPKKTGKKDDTIIPPKFLSDEAMRVFLAQGSEKNESNVLTESSNGVLAILSL